MSHQADQQGPQAGGPLANSSVRAAMRQAWEDSAPHDPTRRHEEGGYIVQDDGGCSVVRWPCGGLGRIVPPPRAADGTYQGQRVIGEFHTHPNPTLDELGRLWLERPSPGDIAGIAREAYPGDSYIIGHHYIYRIGNDGSSSTVGPRVDVLAFPV
jgi:hypothetical protein